MSYIPDFHQIYLFFLKTIILSYISIELSIELYSDMKFKNVMAMENVNNIGM